MRRILLSSNLIPTILVIGCTYGLGSLHGQPKEPNRVSAERFDVVDAEGRVHGSFGLSEDKVPHLSLYDKQGETRLMLYFDENRSITHLIFGDENGKNRLNIFVSPTEGTGLGIRDKKDTDRLEISLNEDDIPGVWMRDRQERVRLAALGSTEGPAGIVVQDENMKSLIKIGEKSKSEPEINYRDPRSGLLRNILNRDDHERLLPHK